jgi:hypothetical protein
LLAVLCSTAHAGPINPTAPDCGTSCVVNMSPGPVLTGHVDTFAIYYGDFSGANAGQSTTVQDVVGDWLNSMNGSDYLNIASVYNGTNGQASTNVTYNGAYDVGNYLGNSLSDDQILQIVQDAKGGSHLPTVDNAIYFVFTAPGIAEQEDSMACGWHNGDASTNTKFAWIGPALGCDFLGGNVSGNLTANEITETGSHELMEALTDPFPNAAFTDNTYGEVGDMCVTSNFNGNLNGHHFDLQSIWTLTNNAQHGVCSQGYKADPVDLPEPSNTALLFGGLGVMAVVARRRKNSLL